MKATNKVALITGSTRGIGRSIARRLASGGTHVALNYAHDDQTAQETQDQIRQLGGKVTLHRADVTQQSAVKSLFEEVQQAQGRIDIVIANAGVELLGVAFTDLTEAQYNTLFDLNTRGAFFTLQYAARHVADHGRIILTSSSTTLHPSPDYSIYGASKAASKYMVEALAQEVGQRKVTANSIVPGPMSDAGAIEKLSDDDPMKREYAQKSPLGRLGNTEDVAGVVAFLCSDASSFITGQHIVVNGYGD